jgi:predicted TIM-barrel fold metal-dependent hydrolase
MEASTPMPGTAASRALISADSHVIEPVELWEGILPNGYWGAEATMFSQRPGGFDPKARTDEMEIDGVSGEVLYPSLAMKLFGLEDAELQRRCFRRYNEWLAEYCTVSPQRLAGIGLVPVYDMTAALEELSWCKDQGLRGVQIWQVPPQDLPFSGTHYEPLWEACAETGLSVSLHILTGFGYAKASYSHGGNFAGKRAVWFKLGINQKLEALQDSLTDLVLSGVLDRHRGLRFVVVENECAWLPFFTDQMDYYFRRSAADNVGKQALERAPSAALADQVFTTFFRDPYADMVAERLGSENLMWSSDYPHGNSTWPHSQEVVEERLGGLPEATVHELVWTNACRVFGIAPDS